MDARSSPSRIGDSALARRLAREIEGEVLFDPYSRGRYSTDASIYQIEPIGVVVPKTAEDIHRTSEIAREAGVPVLPRGAGTSQCGQTVAAAVVVDTSKYLDRVIDFDAARRRVTHTRWQADQSEGAHGREEATNGSDAHGSYMGTHSLSVN